ncbi:MAG TPA: translation elongation factor Ts [Phycisphaerales bacterium]|nr:translation elongation factor Ts [Phycisphaerales bacterium]HMP38394.1 translation elongation factor Ts [Phycisphaerales bacterium]
MTVVNVSAKDAMALRQRTGLGIMDCKAALAETNGDMKAAEDLLRERMKGKMDTRTDRAAGEGCIAIAVAGDAAAIVEIRAETDFTARNDNFRAMASDVARAAAAGPAGPIAPAADVVKRIDDVRITTGENISFARGETLRGGSFAQYIHHDGKLGVLLQYDGAVPAELGTGICQHIAAHVPTPQAIDESGMPKDVVDAHRTEAIKEAEASGKPKEIATKIAEGKMRRFFEDNTLLGQKYVKDDKKSVGEMLPAGVKVLRFLRYAVGGA